MDCDQREGMVSALSNKDRTCNRRLARAFRVCVEFPARWEVFPITVAVFPDFTFIIGETVVYSNVNKTTSGLVPTRNGGPHVPAPYDV